jgi:carbon-monoxide dehydrogenase medium subunit
VSLGGGGEIAKAGIGLTNAGLTPVRAAEAEKFLQGKKPDAATLGQAAALAGEASDPSADRRGSVEYKKQMARVLTARALKKAVERAQGA